MQKTINDDQQLIGFYEIKTILNLRRKKYDETQLFRAEQSWFIRQVKRIEDSSDVWSRKP